MPLPARLPDAAVTARHLPPRLRVVVEVDEGRVLRASGSGYTARRSVVRISTSRTFATLTMTRMLRAAGARRSSGRPAPVTLIGSSLGGTLAILAAARGSERGSSGSCCWRRRSCSPSRATTCCRPSASSEWRQRRRRCRSSTTPTAKNGRSDYAFYEDSLRYDAFDASFAQPTLIFQGLARRRRSTTGRSKLFARAPPERDAVAAGRRSSADGEPAADLAWMSKRSWVSWHEPQAVPGHLAIAEIARPGRAASRASRARPPISPRQVRVGALRGRHVCGQHAPPRDLHRAGAGWRSAPESPPASLEALAIAIRTYTAANAGRHRVRRLRPVRPDALPGDAARPATTEAAAVATAGQILLYTTVSRRRSSTARRAAAGRRCRPRSGLARSIIAVPPVEGRRRMRRRACVERRVHARRFVARAESGRVSRPPVENMRILGRTISGRAGRAADRRLDDEHLQGRICGWPWVRRGWQRSAAFDVKWQDDAYRFEGRGYGHGVGTVCDWLGKAGGRRTLCDRDPREILPWRPHCQCDRAGSHDANRAGSAHHADRGARHHAGAAAGRRGVARGPHQDDRSRPRCARLDAEPPGARSTSRQFHRHS